jgi:hypothetical protein
MGRLKEHDMSESEPITSLSKAQTPEEIGEFWDTHSLADLWDQAHEVDFEVTAKRRRKVALMPELYARLEAETRSRGIQPETPANSRVAADECPATPLLR